MSSLSLGQERFPDAIVWWAGTEFSPSFRGGQGGSRAASFCVHECVIHISSLNDDSLPWVLTLVGDKGLPLGA